MANRTRKAQSAYTGTGRVANTTTGSTTTQAVYRIPTWKNGRECDVLAYEVLGEAPIDVRIEGNNIYRVSLDTAALQNIIENTNLDFSNAELTLGTVNWDVHFTGTITADGTFTGTEVTATTLNSTDATISNLTSDIINSTNANITDLASDKITVVELYATTSELETANIATANIDTSVVEIETVNSSLTVKWIQTNEGTLEVQGDTSLSNVTVSWDETVAGTSTLHDVKAEELEVSGNSSLTELAVSGNTTLNTLTATWASTLSNTVVSWDLTVAWATTHAGTTALVGDTTTGKLNVNNTLTANGTTILNGSTEIHNNATVDGTLRANGNVEVAQSLTVAEQVNSRTMRTDEIVADEVRVNDALHLSEWATAPDFILQTEKGQPNGVPTLDEDGRMPLDQLPIETPTCTFVVGTGVFTNSQTCVINDPRIKLTSYVNLSNYNDIIWDLNEVIWEGWLTITSNETETGSFKYFVVTPIE